MKSGNPLDLKVGMEYYSRPCVFLGNEVFAELSPDTFKVYEEVYGLGVARAPRSHLYGTRCLSGRKFLAVMCKSGISTLEASWIARRLGLSLEYWGMKDAEAETCQFVVLKCLKEVELVPRIHKKIELYVVRALNQEITPKKHQLSRNIFEVVVNYRGEQHEFLVSTIEASASLSYLNYFGYQRFGTLRPVTHIVGRAIALSDYEDAMNYLVGYSTEAESPKTQLARKLYTEGYYMESLKAFPKNFFIERSVLKKYAETGSYRKAIVRGLPRGLLKFFVEAYQSFLFNKALSLLAETSGSIEDVEKLCDVIELPRPGLPAEGCRRFPHEAIQEDLGSKTTKVSKSLFTVSAREVVFRVQDLCVSNQQGNSLRLIFSLGRGSYATVYLRELLRENLLLSKHRQ